MLAAVALEQVTKGERCFWKRVSFVLNSGLSRRLQGQFACEKRSFTPAFHCAAAASGLCFLLAVHKDDFC